MKNSDKIYLVIGSIAIIGAATIGGAALLRNDADADEINATTPTASTSSNASGEPTTPTSNSQTDTTQVTGGYTDGTYTATASYSVPHGDSNSLTTEVTIVDGVITTVTTTNNTNDRESEFYIANFEESLSGASVGQSIASYTPSRIGGASLTTAAFDDALDTIRNDAAA